MLGFLAADFQGWLSFFKTGRIDFCCLQLSTPATCDHLARQSGNMCRTLKTESCLWCPSSSDAQGGPGRQRGKGSDAHFASGEAWLKTSVLWPWSQHRSSQAHRKSQSLIQESQGAHLAWGVHLPIPLTQHRAELEMYWAPTRHPTLKKQILYKSIPSQARGL